MRGFNRAVDGMKGFFPASECISKEGKLRGWKCRVEFAGAYLYGRNREYDGSCCHRRSCGWTLKSRPGLFFEMPLLKPHQHMWPERRYSAPPIVIAITVLFF